MKSRPILRISSPEFSGPSGAGTRAGAHRNPRRDFGIRLTVPTLRAERKKESA